MSIPTEASVLLADKIEESALTRRPVEGNLRTNDRIIARVTDGIYREPWSAFRELISNAYDADATRVSVDCDYPFFKEIRISDDGNGMDENIVGDLLENIGGSSKRTARGKRLGTASKTDPTKSPAGRKLIGKIGIGLFAVAQLTQQFQIITKRKGDSKRVSASIRLHTYQEDSLVNEQDASNYVSGTYSVLAEETDDLEVHGTTIILTGIRPAIREKLQSYDIWSAIDENGMDDGSGLIDALLPPRYNIGRFDDDGSLIEPPSLPWDYNDSPETKFRKLVDAAISTAKTSKEQVNLAHFDNYLKMIWRISVASPIAYIDGHPFDLREEDGYDVYEVSNKKKGSASRVMLQGKTLREAFQLIAGREEHLPFEVSIDGVQLRRPIKLPNFLYSYSRLERPLIFVGKVMTSFGGVTAQRSGGKLSFEAYIYWNTRIVPKENIGSIIRVNDASGTLFDPEFLNYQVSEQTRKKQVTCEIFVTEGLDGALNIDRESFNTSNPHYLYIQKWLHGAFRQFATMHKRLGREAATFEAVAEAPRAFHDRSVEIWSKMRGNSDPPPLIVRQPSMLEDNFLIGDIPIVLSRRTNSPAVSKRTELIDAVTLVLDAHGILDVLTDEGRAELIFDLVSIIERAA